MAPRLLFGALAALSATVPATAQDGRLDRSFGVEGVSVHEFDSLGTLMWTNDLERQSTGRLLIPLCVQLEDGVTTSGYVAGLTSDGVLDETFATSGLLRFSDSRCPNSIAVLPDDRIVAVAGRLYERGPASRVTSVSGGAVLGFTADGRTDTAFGAGGRAAFPTTFEPQVVTADQGLVTVAGTMGFGTPVTVARLGLGGTLDPSYGTGGLATGPRFVFGPTALAVDRSGRAVVADEVEEPGGGLDPSSGGYIFRFTSVGAVDTTFGESGFVRFRRPPNERVYAVDIDPEGMPIVAGASGTLQRSRAEATRFLEDGTRDENFDVNVSASVPACEVGAPESRCEEFTDLEVDGSGAIYVTATSRNLFLGRLRRDGTFDPAFGDGGGVAADLDGRVGVPGQSSLLIQPDRSVIVLSAVRPSRGGSVTVALARYVVGNPVANESDILEGASVRVFPNPASRATTVSLTLVEPSTVALEVFDTRGRLVRDLEVVRAAGPGAIEVNLGGLPSGLYLVRVRVGNRVETIPVSVVR